MRGSTTPRRSPLASESQGFALVEVVLSVAVIFVVLAAMMGAYVRVVGTVWLARQRQQAAALASQSMEQLRALPFGILSAGLVSTDVDNDPNVVADSDGARLHLPASGVDEQIVADGTPQTPAPLYPHVAPSTVDGVRYVVSTYVTQASDESPYSLTAVVQWTSSAGGAPRLLVQRSATYAPGSCLSAATHPFIGPCQSGFSADAGPTGGSIAVTNNLDPSQPVVGFNGTGLSLDLPELSAGLVTEQSARATTMITTTQASTNDEDDDTTSGGQSALVASSSNPSDFLPASSSETVPAQTSDPIELTGSAGILRAIPSDADTGSGMTDALGAALCPHPWAGALPPGQPCAAGTVRASGSEAVITADLGGTADVRSLDPFDLARVTAPSVAEAVAAKVLTANPIACPATSGDGCAYAAAARNLGTLSLGGLPADSAPKDTRPDGFASAVSIAGLNETAVAEAGRGEREPSYTRTGGVLSYWKGHGMVNVPLTGSKVPPIIDPPAIQATYVGESGKVTVKVDPRITIGSPVTTSTGNLPCTNQRCTRTVTGGAITVSLVYTVTTAGTLTTRFEVSATIGGLVSKASYQGAPGA
jgi:hypothetical protein